MGLRFVCIDTVNTTTVVTVQLKSHSTVRFRASPSGGGVTDTIPINKSAFFFVIGNSSGNSMWKILNGMPC